MSLVTRSHRMLGRCKACRTVVVTVTRDTIGSQMSTACPTCDRPVWVKRVFGSSSPKVCDARCMNAIGPNCDCSCAGENHGAGHGAR